MPFTTCALFSADNAVGESSMMLYSSYNLVVSGILLLVINSVAVIPPGIWIVVASAISFFAVMFSLCVLFVPKIYLHLSGANVNVQELFGAAARKGERSEFQSSNEHERDSGNDKGDTEHGQGSVSGSARCVLHCLLNSMLFFLR